jgi:queuine tRNA-ribosyltransferase
MEMFDITAEDRTTSARTGELRTAHGRLRTPFFMPVATKGAVRFMDFAGLKNTGTECIISNSLLLYQKPGLETIRKAGGLHKFYSWDRGIFTDSGGFQTLDSFFLESSTEEGAPFRSPYSGKSELITPEKAMEIQLALGPDVAMCLDDVPKHDDPLQAVRSKTLRTHSWARRCKAYHDEHKKKQLLFGIAQGGTHKDIRKKSIEFIKALDFDGIAMGGLAIGEPISTMYEMIWASVSHLPKTKPRYLMGVGSPQDLLECISQGVDCFDSTFPTQNARHGTLFTWNGNLNIGRREYASDLGPIEDGCGCPTCKNHSRAYVRHLLGLNEPAGKILATQHNLHFIQNLIQKSREAIGEGKFEKFRAGVAKKFSKKA